MITADMPNTNNANAQLFHRSPNAVNPESFRGSTLERGKVGALRRSDAAARCLPHRLIGQKPPVSLCDSFAQSDRWLPAEFSNFGHVQKLARCAVRLRFVPNQFTVETDYITD